MNADDKTGLLPLHEVVEGAAFWLRQRFRAASGRLAEAPRGEVAVQVYAASVLTVPSEQAVRIGLRHNDHPPVGRRPVPQAPEQMLTEDGATWFVAVDRTDDHDARFVPIEGVRLNRLALTGEADDPHMGLGEKH